MNHTWGRNGGDFGSGEGVRCETPPTTTPMKPLVSAWALCVLLPLAAAASRLRPVLQSAESPVQSHAGARGSEGHPRVENGPECADFARACALEAAGDYPAAFDLYEDKQSTCGLAGWARVGVLGAGHASAVALRETPCGTRVAVKRTQTNIPKSAVQVEFDHRVLEFLQASVGRECPRCFPIPYHYSNRTGVSYLEYVPSVPVVTYLSTLRVRTAGGLGALKDLLSGTLSILAIFTRLHLRHNDLTFRNTFMRVPYNSGSGTEAPSLVVMDFGSSKSDAMGMLPGVDFTRMGNRGHSDCYTVACSYYGMYYPGEWDCRAHRPRSASGDPGHFKSFLVDMMVRCRDADGQPPYDDIRQRLERVQTV